MKNNKAAMMSLILGGMMGGFPDEPRTKTPEEKRKILERKKLNNADILKLKKGLKEFFYGENSVWAMNEKTAIKKATKKGYL